MKANDIAPALEINSNAAPTRWCPNCRHACAAWSTGPRPHGKPQGWACSRCGAMVVADRPTTARSLDELLRQGESAEEFRREIMELHRSLHDLAVVAQNRANEDGATVADIQLDRAARTLQLKLDGMQRDAVVQIGRGLSDEELERVRVERLVQREFSWSCSGAARALRGGTDADPTAVRAKVLRKEHHLAELRASRAVADHFEEVN